MKSVVEILRKNGIVCKELNRVNLNLKKRINAYLGVNLKSEYCIVIEVLKKSRFLAKDIETLEEIVSKFPINFRYKKKILILNAPLCLKAKKELREWKILLKKNLN